ncbi:Serine proteinase stubble-like protein [Dinothrombium tinctorium]|uniref:Acrosin n=1 Tax=Dinothrombium tinctorium TaxID=1965070 RepID=A0A3S3S2W2_9ACAR|nr:Serine proteinase stubble-like protein [Dinothrombium tinctorium]RWS08381.1 Serine proteinase stubble-like protein [Dinothrombium tinctorium]
MARVENGNCGTRTYDPPGGRVVGGRPAERSEYPWQVGIQLKEGDGYLIRGGGVILNKRWILTAAHVFLSDDKLEDYRGLIGVTKLDEEPIIVKFDKLIKHEDYADDPGVFENDIALLHTTEDMPLLPKVDNVNSICLPRKNELFKGKVAVTGWGVTNEQGSESNTLMTVDIRILPDKVCERNFKEYFVKKIMTCAGKLSGGKDSCRGDSGGPLVQKSAENGRFYLVGVVSFGGYQKCARRGSGASYTKVPYYVDWIQKRIN